MKDEPFDELNMMQAEDEELFKHKTVY